MSVAHGKIAGAGRKCNVVKAAVENLMEPQLKIDLNK
jgi:hypothetical protein